MGVSTARARIIGAALAHGHPRSVMLLKFTGEAFGQGGGWFGEQERRLGACPT